MGDGLSTFSGCLNHVAQRYPARLAIAVPGGENMFYAHLRHSVEKHASQLRAVGVGPRDAVALVFSDDVEWLVSLLAVMRIRAVVVPLEQAFMVEGFEPYLKNYEVKFLIGSEESYLITWPAAAGFGIVPCPVSLPALRPGDAANLSEVINEPGDTAILLPTARDDEHKLVVTQGELAKLLVTSVNQRVSPSDPGVARLHLLFRGHGHLCSMFSLLAAAVGAEGVAEGGRDGAGAGAGNTTDYGARLPELSLAFAVPFLIGLLLKYLPVPSSSHRWAILLFYLTVPFSITGVAVQSTMNRGGRWFGAVGLALDTAGVATLVLPALDSWEGTVACVATVVCEVLSTAMVIRGVPWRGWLPPSGEKVGRAVLPPKTLTTWFRRWLPQSWPWLQGERGGLSLYSTLSTTSKRFHDRDLRVTVVTHSQQYWTELKGSRS